MIYSDDSWNQGKTRQALTCSTRSVDQTITPSFDVKPFPRNSLVHFAENIRCLRKERGLTQEQVAEMLDITGRHYQKLEAATVTPTFGVLVQLRKALKAEWADLLSGV